MSAARWPLLILSVAALASCGPRTSAPTGYKDFAWGTPFREMEERFFDVPGSGCVWVNTVADIAKSCPLYAGDIEAEAVFEFSGPSREEWRFGAYTLVTNRKNIATLRKTAEEKFGPGTAWRWPTTSARLIEVCGSGSSCLSVSSAAHDAAMTEKETARVRALGRKF